LNGNATIKRYLVADQLDEPTNRKEVEHDRELEGDSLSYRCRGAAGLPGSGEVEAARCCAVNRLYPGLRAGIRRFLWSSRRWTLYTELTNPVARFQPRLSDWPQELIVVVLIRRVALLRSADIVCGSARFF